MNCYLGRSVLKLAILVTALATAGATANHLLPDGEEDKKENEATVKTFTNLYSRANDDTRQNSVAEGGGGAGDAYEVTLMRCQLKTESAPDGTVKAAFNWNAQMTTGRHLGEASSYEMRWVQNTEEGQKDSKYRAPDATTLAADRQKTLSTKWRNPKHATGSEEVKRGSSMTVEQFNLGQVKANGKEQVIKGKLEIRLKNWKVLDDLYTRSKGKEGFKGGVFQLVDYEVKVDGKGKIASGSVGCTRPKDPNFKLFLSNFKKGFGEFDPDTYDDVRFDYCRVANRVAEAKAKGKTVPKALAKVTHEFPEKDRPSPADCKEWTKASNDRNRRYRDQPPGANCEHEDVGGGKRLTPDEQKKAAQIPPKDLDASQKDTLRLAAVLKGNNCADCHGKEGAEEYAKTHKGKEAGYRVCDSGNWKDGTPLFLGDMLNFAAPMILEGKILPNPGGRYPASMMRGLDKMIKEMIRMGAEKRFEKDPKMKEKVAAAVKLWDDRKELGQGDLPADNPLTKQLNEVMEPARELFCRQATVAGINDGGSYIAKQCGTRLFFNAPEGREERFWAQGLEQPAFAAVLQRLDHETADRQWRLLVQAMLEIGAVDSFL